MVRLFICTLVSLTSIFWPWCIHRSGISAWVAAWIHWALPLPTGHYPELLVDLTARDHFIVFDAAQLKEMHEIDSFKDLTVHFGWVIGINCLRMLLIWKDMFLFWCLGIHKLKLYRWYIVIADTIKVIQFHSRLAVDVLSLAGRSEQRRWIVSYWACSAPPGGRSSAAESESMENNCWTWKRKILLYF